MSLAGNKPSAVTGASIPRSSLGGVAIIGMAGRFPGARNVDELWCNLRDGKEGITFFSDEELISAGVEESLLRNPRYVKAAGVLDDISLFDAELFGYSPAEAELMDPQHRIFLECAWQALENAGYCATRCDHPIGIFAGAGISTYLAYLHSNPELVGRVDYNQVTLGNEKQYLTSRVAYRLNLRGPAITVQTACSTSLVAVHLAAQSLFSHECDMALAGGVLVCAMKTGYLHTEGGILSPDGHNRSFDQAARGTVGGNGCGIVVLKRLEDALRDGDHIRAVIRGSAINNDGAMKVGFTAPAVDGQAEVIVRSHALAGIGADSISYLETHGSATPLGDPVEISASTKAFQFTTDRKQFCAIGSVKSNLGHLGEAAGIAGLIKTALALEHKMIPPSLHFRNPNPAIRFEDSPFFVNTTLRKWERNGTPLRAGVSSFGIGGTNVHVIVEEAPVSLDSPAEPVPQLLVLSARTGTALKTVVENLMQYFKEKGGINLADAAFTLQTGRQEFDQRCFVVSRNTEDAIAQLGNFSSTGTKVTTRSTEVRNPAFIFPGVVHNYSGMSQEIYRDIPFFASVLDECFGLIKALTGSDAKHILYPEADDAVSSSLLSRPSLLHPILFSVEYSLGRLCMHWGIDSQVMAGYGVGEYVAACLANVFSLKDALTLVVEQAKLIESLPQDDFLTVSLSEDAVQPLLGNQTSLALTYGKDQCLLAGNPNAIGRIEEQLKDGTRVSRLASNQLFYCRRAKLVRERVEKLLRDITLHPPKTPYFSSVTGTPIDEKDAISRQYWSELWGATIRLSASLENLQKITSAPWLEIGPANALGELSREARPTDQKNCPILVSTMGGKAGNKSETEYLLTAIGKLWSAGTPVRWASLHNNGERRRIPLPPYPFDRRRYWAEREKRAAATSPSAAPSPIADWFYVPSWKLAPASLISPTIDTQISYKWLIFVDDDGLGTLLHEKLRSYGHQVVAVHKGASFQQLSECSYTIRPDARDDYELLISRVVEKHAGLDRVAHLWGLTGSSPIENPNFADVQVCGFYSLLHLAATLKSTRGLGTVKVQVVADCLLGITGAEMISPEKATMVGLGMVAQQEAPNLSVRYLDVGCLAERASYPLVAGPLLSELVSDSNDFMVALRGKRRWIRSFEPMHFSDDANAPGRWLQPKGVYVLTGGLGRIGLLLADFLARTLKAKLVFVGRSEIPRPELWHHLPESCDPQTVQIVAKLRAMQEQGAEIMLASANASSLDEMESVMEQAQQRFGRIHGIFHLAGVALSKAMEETTARDVAEVFDGKVHGLRVLEKLAKHYQPEFCVLFSSNASVLGGLGFSAYSAANCFLDFYAAQANSEGGVTHWISINWDGWVMPEHLGDKCLSSSMARYVMQPDEAIEALRRILVSAREDQIVVSREDLGQRIATWVQRERDRHETDTNQSPCPQRYPRPHLQNEYVCPRSQTEAAIVEILQDLLRIEAVGVEDDFFDLGGDSLMAIDLSSRIRSKFEIDLPVRTMVSAPTAAQLGEIVDAMQKEMMSVLQELEHLE